MCKQVLYQAAHSRSRLRAKIMVHTAFESRVQAIGQHLLHQSGIMEKKRSRFDRWLRLFIQRLADNSRFRVQALRFIDVLPTLEDDRDLVRHMQEYFSAGDFPLPDVLQWGIEHNDSALAAHLLAPMMREMTVRIGRRFIAGETAEQGWKAIQKLDNEGKLASLDILGEAVLSESEADSYQQAYLSLIDKLGPKMHQLGSPLQLSLKISSLYSQLVPQAPEYGSEMIRKRLRPIIAALRKHDGGLTFDMEHYDIRHITLMVFCELLSEPDFADWSQGSIAIQAYLKESLQDLERLIDWATQRGSPVGVRLVRGAYWDLEKVVAQRENWVIPVWENKSQTDRCYEQCLRLLLEQHRTVRPLIAGHNVRSIAVAIALIEELGLDKRDYEFQMLYGMAEGLQAALVAMGHPLRVYVPVGPIIPGMAYLVRRFLENSSNTSFLRMAFIENRADAELLRQPGGGHDPDS